MSVYREGIENVEVFRLPDGIAADGGSACVCGAAIVTWRSSHAGKLHQVYVNECLAGMTIDCEHRFVLKLLGVCTGIYLHLRTLFGCILTRYALFCADFYWIDASKSKIAFLFSGERGFI